MGWDRQGLRSADGGNSLERLQSWKTKQGQEGKQEIKNQESSCHPQAGGSEGRQVLSLREPRG